jgi:membrane associated rhomboid family serine protease
MGIYDRDYYRPEEPGYHVSIASWSLTTKIVIVNVAVYLLQLLAKQQPGDMGWLGGTFALDANWWTQPWTFFQLLTYGFLHSPDYIWHIVFNMLVLWFFGRELEARYSRKEFLLFYLAGIVVAGLIWSGVQYFYWGSRATCLGASGGVAAVVVLFAFNFPRREVLLWFVIPMPMWALAMFWVATDIYGAINQSSNIGYEAHLGGAAFALAYYKLGWRLGGGMPSGLGWPSMRRSPNLRVHRPEGAPDEDLESRVDQILTKIQEQGLDSLTRKERQILEKAGQKYKERGR